MFIKIDCPENPVVSFAREEIIRYLSLAEDISSKEVIASLDNYNITISCTAASQEQNDAFEISSDDKQCIIKAQNPRCVLIGAYRFLHDLGFRFLAPGHNNELIPALCESSFTMHIKTTASFMHRGVCIEGAESIENIVDFIDWLPKAGFNSFFIQHDNANAFLKRWYEHIYNPLLDSEKLDDAQYAVFNRQIDAALAQRGLLVHRVGHGWTSKVIGTDNVCEKSDTKPQCPVEYIALTHGKRDYFDGVPSNTNLCYSNDCAVDDFVKQVKEYLAAHPETAYLHIWLADENNNICECADCCATTLSDQYIDLLNRVDSELIAMNSHVKIALLLYQELLWPPKTAVLNNPQHFVLVFAPISRIFEKSYKEIGDIPPVPEYHRNHIVLPNSLEENISFLKAWQKNYEIDSFVYDYPLGRAHYGDLGYIQITKTIIEDIQSLKGLKLNGYMSCQELRCAFPSNIPCYVMGSMLWDCEQNGNDIIAEYCIAAYGKRAKQVLSYFALLSEMSSCDYFNGIGNRENLELAAKYQEIPRVVDAFLKKAAELAPENAVERYNQNILDYHAEYCKLIAKALAALMNGDKVCADAYWKDVMHLLRANETAQQQALDVYRILEVATKYTGFHLDIPR